MGGYRSVRVGGSGGHNVLLLQQVFVDGLRLLPFLFNEGVARDPRQCAFKKKGICKPTWVGHLRMITLALVHVGGG